MLLQLILVTLLTWLIIRQYQKVSRLPPGPISLPLLGNVFQIAFWVWKTGGIVAMLDAMRKKYGNVFTLWLGPVPHVSITDYDISHEVFVKNATKYADKFSAPLIQELRNGHGVAATNGEVWQELRKFSMLTLRNFGMGKDLMEVKIIEELNARCADIDRKAINGVTITQAADFFDLTVGSLINSILVGKRFEEDNKGEFLKIKNAIDRSMEVMSPLDMTLPVWMLKKFFGRRYNLIMSTQITANDFAAREAVERLEKIKEGKYTVDPENLKDYTDAFILKMQRGDMSEIYTVENLKTMIADLWLTGQETTTTTLISGFNQLLLHPHVIEKARKELLSVTANHQRDLSLSDKNSTPYLNAVVGEVQRHASILNVNFWRYNYELTNVGGYPVDSGALIAAQLSAMHLNEEIFENPREFNPERFVKNEKLLQHIIPFGIGKRSCLGEALARAELYLIFGNLLLRYHFKPSGKLSTSELLPLSAFKRPFKLEMQFIKA